MLISFLMHEDLERLANLTIAKAREELARTVEAEISDKMIEAHWKGQTRTGATETAKFNIRMRAGENECRTVAETWVKLITKRQGVLTEEDLIFILARVQECALNRQGQIVHVMSNDPGGGLVPANYWSAQAETRMRRIESEIRRDLEIVLHEQRAFPNAEPELPSLQLNIRNANISNLNLGSQVGTINAALQVLSTESAEHQALADALKRLTEAVANSRDLEPGKKRDAVEALSTLASEAETGKGKGSVTVRALIAWLPAALGTSADVITLWDKFGPTLRAFFGL